MFDRLWNSDQISREVMVNISETQVSSLWRTGAVMLVVALVVSWVYMGYRLLDAGSSVTDCYSQVELQAQDIAFLAEAGSGRLTAKDVLSVMAKRNPGLPSRLDDDRALLLQTVSLQFGDDLLLKGLLRP